MEVPSLDVVRFGAYEIRPSTRELFKHGIRVKLPPQAFEVLRLLLERKGELVTRQEFHHVLWRADTFVDFDQGLNNAIKRIREVLNDSAEAPRYIETLPRLGYRFVGRVERSNLGLPARVLDAAAPSEPSSSHREVRPTSREEVGASPRPAAAPSKPEPWVRRHPYGIAACVIVGLVATVVAVTYPRFQPRADLGRLTPTPFTAYRGLEIAPTFSPDGSQIAFAWDGEPTPGSKGFDLYIKVVGAESLLRLTNHPAEQLDPAWSPDGSQIAFDRGSGPDSGVYVVPALGGPERKLRSTHVLAVAAPVSWSPDGKLIAFADAQLPEGHRRLYLLSVESLAATQIPHAEPCLDEMYPAFSRNGRYLAYVCYLHDGGFGVYSIARPDGGPKLLKIFSGWAWGITWTADDKRLILSRYEGGTPASELLELTFADGSLRTLPFGRDGQWPAVSAMGGRLAFALNHGHCDIWRRDLLSPQLSARQFISSTHDQLDPQYSPDGKHVTFASDRGGSPEVWMSDADGGNLVQISNLKNPTTGSARWSPDGRKVVFDSGKFGNASLYIADVSERLPRRIVTNVRSASVPSWSRDGRWIYFVGDGNEFGGKIYRCRPEGGDAEVVSDQLGYGPVESFDGKTVYYVSSVAGSWVLESVPVGRPGAESAVAGAPPIFFATHWTLTPRGVYFVPAEAHTSLHYFDFATRQSRESFAQETGFYLGLSVSPDGRWVLYPLAQPTSDIMLVENFH